MTPSTNKNARVVAAELVHLLRREHDRVSKVTGPHNSLYAKAAEALEALQTENRLLHKAGREFDPQFSILFRDALRD